MAQAAPRSGPPAAAPLPAAGPAAGRHVLFTAVRNEAPFLLEWIAYHKAIGFDRVIVFSNQSDDGTDELLAALARAGEIEHHPHVVPEGVSPQGNAARLANQRGLLGDGDWVLWLDADEFLVINAGGGLLPDLIAALGDRRGVLIPWRIFGDGGNATFPGRFVSDAFVKASRRGFAANTEIKTLFRAGDGILGFSIGGINRPMLSPGGAFDQSSFLSAAGQPLVDNQLNRRWLAGADFLQTRKVSREEHGYRLAQINHYCVRTPEHFALKKSRGRGWAAGQVGDSNQRHTADFYQKMNRNDVEDRAILRFEEATTLGIRALRRNAAVRSADNLAQKTVAGMAARTQGVGSAGAVKQDIAVTPEPREAETPRRGGREPNGCKVLFSAVRNEAPFLLEWIAYHKAIGFDRFIIFSNDSDDGTDELLAALAEAGEIEHHRHVVPEGVSPQANAARLANEKGLLADGDWVIWLDADEFLVVNSDRGRLEDLLSALGDRHGVIIPWRLFGDGGNATFTGRFVSKDFCRAAKKMYARMCEAKTLFRMGDGIRGFASQGVHRPLLDADAGLTPEGFLCANGTTLDRDNRLTRRWLAGDDFPRTARLGVRELGYRLAQINHYCVRTPEHFALKKSRGRGWVAGQVGETNLRHNAGFYQKMNRNDVEDRAILRFEAEVTEGIAALRRHAGVRRADDRARKLVAARIAALPAGTPAEVAPAPPAATGDFPLTLPPDAAALVREVYGRAGCVLEYGSGGSTLLALDVGVAHVFSVESDAGWADRLRKVAMERFPGRHCELHHADIGPTGAWGRPADASGHARYHRYATEVWDRPDFVHPDVVLVDGRFRAACLLTVTLRCTRPVTVLFDDYAGRPEYHWVEDFIRPRALTGRMAVFDVTPTRLPPEHLTRIVGAFSDQR